MRTVTGFIFAIALALAAVTHVNAQAADTIWLAANQTAYKTGETVIVTVNAASATPIQGFTFQIRYDPACLQSISATSPIPGMNGLSLPQTPGLVDASYAATSPQPTDGVLAEVHFTALKGCQTDLTLETAALAVRNESGFAAPLAGVTIGAKELVLNVDNSIGIAQPTQPASAATLPLTPTVSSEQNYVGWAISILAVLLIVGILVGIFALLRTGPAAAPKKQAHSPNITLYFRHGPRTGKKVTLNKLPCRIGRDPMNEICLNDPNIISQHAQIFTANNGYYLADLGGETFVNGRAVQKSSAMLKPGDVVRLGKNALFVFGS